MSTATLKNASMEYAFKGRFLVGEIYGDPQSRFEDGLRIFTSWIDREIDPRTFLCRSGITYHVESWRYPIQDDPGDVTNST